MHNNSEQWLYWEEERTKKKKKKKFFSTKNIWWSQTEEPNGVTTSTSNYHHNHHPHYHHSKFHWKWGRGRGRAAVQNSGGERHRFLPPLLRQTKYTQLTVHSTAAHFLRCVFSVLFQLRWCRHRTEHSTPSIDQTDRQWSQMGEHRKQQQQQLS